MIAVIFYIDPKLKLNIIINSNKKTKILDFFSEKFNKKVICTKLKVHRIFFVTFQSLEVFLYND